MSKQVRIEISHYRKDEFEKLVNDAIKAGFVQNGGTRIEYGRYNATLEKTAQGLQQAPKEGLSVVQEAPVAEEPSTDEAVKPKRKRKSKVTEE